jgi:hypothetical protein
LGEITIVWTLEAKARCGFLSAAQVTIERLLKLEHIMGIKVRELRSFIDKKCKLEKLLKS